MDCLDITGLKIMTTIGIHPWEQQIKQLLLIDVNIPLDVSECHDDIQKTINYDQLCQEITAFVSGKAFLLIETVAEEVALRIKADFGVGKLTIRVHKPHAIKNAQDIVITVTR